MQHLNIRTGTFIGGHYEVIKLLGTGSMGAVYVCKHKELNGLLAAVKVLSPDISNDEVSISRFKNGIYATYNISHPNVVRSYEIIIEHGLFAYAMEYIKGYDLADRLSNSENVFSISETISILMQICAGVQAIHEAGVIHRDLKPENILITNKGEVKITDFGVARLNNSPRLTAHGGVVGTMNYVSPEYLLSSQLDSRSDIYAIGIMGYEMLIGEPPFKSNNLIESVSSRVKNDPTSPRLKRLDISLELDRIILKAVARNPDNRYQTSEQMLNDLVELNKSTSQNSKNTPNTNIASKKLSEVLNQKSNSFKTVNLKTEPLQISKIYDSSIHFTKIPLNKSNNSNYSETLQLLPEINYGKVQYSNTQYGNALRQPEFVEEIKTEDLTESKKFSNFQTIVLNDIYPEKKISKNIDVNTTQTSLQKKTPATDNLKKVVSRDPSSTNLNGSKFKINKNINKSNDKLKVTSDNIVTVKKSEDILLAPQNVADKKNQDKNNEKSLKEISNQKPVKPTKPVQIMETGLIISPVSKEKNNVKLINKVSSKSNNSSTIVDERNNQGRLLLEFSQKKRKTFATDILVIFIALSTGIFIGLYILKKYFPHLFSSIH